MSNPEHAPILGQILDGKYRIEKQIGQGGMGAVYLAIHEGTGRSVALKVITPELMIDEAIVERFQREARAAGRLRHPHVVNVTDFGFTQAEGERIAYLVMEHLEGQTLAELLEKEGRLPLPVAVDILEQTCTAVEAAHRHDIVHRDLKPENIWLEPAVSGGYHVKVLDFGVAKLRAGPQAPEPVPEEVPPEHEVALRHVDPDASTLVVVTPVETGQAPADNGSLTNRGVLLGTPLYMSPEQWLNRAVDGRADVYALGVIAYRVLAGEPPFTGRTAALSIEHIRKPPAPLSAHAPDLPPAVVNVVMRALEKDPAKRPQSALAFATALAAAAEDSGDLFRRAFTLSAEHFPMLVRVAFIAHGPVLALALLRIAKCRLVDSGVLSAEVGGAIGTVAKALHALAVIFLVPVSIGLVTPRVMELEGERRRSSRAPRWGQPSWTEIARCLRASLLPTALVTVLSLSLVLAIRVPLEWLAARAGLFDRMLVQDVLAAAFVETLSILLFARLARGLAVYPAVVTVESCTGMAALRRSLALTRPCPAEAGSSLVFHFLPRSIIVPWCMLALAQLSGLSYGVIVNTASDTQMSGVALLSLYAMYLFIAPFGMTAIALLYLKARRIEGACPSAP